MPSTNNDPTEMRPSAAAGKMSPACSAQKITHSVALLASCPGATGHCIPNPNQSGESLAAGGGGTKRPESIALNGQTLVISLDHKEQSAGEFWMPNISEWPNDAAVSFLSQVLEVDLIPERYYLSPKACAGILRRAEKRGRQLPPLLQTALERVVQTTTKGKPVVGALDAHDAVKWGKQGKAIPCWWDGGQISQTLDAVLYKGQAMPEKNRFPAVLEPVAVRTAQTSSNGWGVSLDGSAYTLDRAQVQAVAVSENQRAEVTTSDIVGSLSQGGGKAGQGYPAVMFDMAVRRLTPTECERLQGFPDGHTDIPYKNKAAPDGPRYKAIGNSKAVPAVRWLGSRLLKELTT